MFFFSFIATATKSAAKAKNVSSLSVPNLVEDNDKEHETPIQRNSVLEASFRRHHQQQQGQTPISYQQENGRVSRASTFKVIGQNGGIGVPLPDPGDVPDGHNVHLLEINMNTNEILGISLVPSLRELKGYFQVL